LAIDVYSSAMSSSWCSLYFFFLNLMLDGWGLTANTERVDPRLHNLAVIA